MPLLGREPGRGNVYLDKSTIVLGTSGPTRVAADEDAEPVKPLSPLGFTSREQFEAQTEVEPLLWDGD